MIVDANPLLSHEWGESIAADRVWGEVCGRAPRTKPWRRGFMVLQAYLDESYSDGGAYVLGGYLASAESWASFSAEWEKLLPRTGFSSKGNHRFKMAEMSKRTEDLPAFYDIIHRHVSFSMCLIIDAQDLERAKGRIWSDNTRLVWTQGNSLAVVAFRLFFQIFYQYCWDDARFKKLIQPGEQIDLYLDKHNQAEWMIEAWDSVMPALDDHIHLIAGDTPRFVDDEKFLPIQAADFWVWCARKGYETGTLDDVCQGDFGAWKGPKVPGFKYVFDEDRLAIAIASMFKHAAAIPGLINIYDSKTHPRTENALHAEVFENRSSFLSFIEKQWKIIRKRR